MNATSGWIDPNPSDGKGPRVDRILITSGVGLTAVVLLTLVGVVMAKHHGLFGSGYTERPAVALVRSDVAGDDAFMPSVVVSPIEIGDGVASDSAAFTDQLPRSAARGVRLVSGTQRGLYGAAGNEGLCDVPTVANYLDAHPERATAWGKAVGGVTRQQIPYYLNTLTPVVLIADTWVTAAGFSEGAAVSEQAVLQAGTAVLIDGAGVPRVRCAAGNPLAPPDNVDLTALSVEGEPWPDFSADNVVAVAYSLGGATESVVTEFELRDVVTGEPVIRKAGGVIAIGPDPTGWTPDPVAMNIPAKG